MQESDKALESNKALENNEACDYSENRICFLFIGPSGSGKTTISELLQKKYGWRVLNSYTTRPPRFPDETGHIFVSDAEFPDEDEQLVAYVEYAGYKYGATAAQVDDSDIYVVDPDGAKKLEALYHGKRRLVRVVFEVAEYERRERMKQRGDSEESIEQRIALDREIFTDVPYDLKVFRGTACPTWRDDTEITPERAAMEMDMAMRLLNLRELR